MQAWHGRLAALAVFSQFLPDGSAEFLLDLASTERPCDRTAPGLDKFRGQETGHAWNEETGHELDEDILEELWQELDRSPQKVEIDELPRFATSPVPGSPRRSARQSTRRQPTGRQSTGRQSTGRKSTGKQSTGRSSKKTAVPSMEQSRATEPKTPKAGQEPKTPKAGQEPKTPKAGQRDRRSPGDGPACSPLKERKMAALDATGGSLLKHAKQEEEEWPEWPESSAQCEGCQRVTDGCEVYGSSCALLCPSCTKMKSPPVWALARECMRMQAGIVA